MGEATGIEEAQQAQEQAAASRNFEAMWLIDESGKG